LRVAAETKTEIATDLGFSTGGGFVEALCLVFHAHSSPPWSRTRDVIVPNSPAAQSGRRFVRNTSQGDKRMQQPRARQEGAEPPHGEPPIWGQRRRRIRDDLDRFLRNEERPISRNHFATLLNAEFGTKVSEVTIRRFLDRDAKSVSDTVVRDIDAYLDRYVRPEWEKDQAESEAAAKSLFEAARTFFHMRPDDAKPYRDSVPGTYRFYAYSELAGGRDVVCLGAIKFAKDFSVEELQSSIEPNDKKISEEFHGHYIYYRNCCIAMLRNKDGWKPKFYILYIPPYLAEDDGKRQSLTGLQLKVGEERHVFGSTIHMVRNKDAFKETNSVPRSSEKEVGERILEILDSQRWFPK
jgi:hypothetical protein